MACVSACPVDPLSDCLAFVCLAVPRDHFTGALRRALSRQQPGALRAQQPA